MSSLRHDITFTVGTALARIVPRRWRPVIFTRIMDRPDVLHEFWRQEAPQGNLPTDYVAAEGRSHALLELVEDLPRGARILEVGCNVGRNLAHLADAGFDVEGVEINPNAVRILRSTYPQLADAPIHLGPAETVLPTLPDNMFDLVFTMAVIEHIHPDSRVVFDRMAKLAPQILAIEPPGSVTHRQYPHDVPELFTARGMEFVAKTPMVQLSGTADDPGINWYTAYRFARS